MGLQLVTMAEDRRGVLGICVYACVGPRASERVVITRKYSYRRRRDNLNPKFVKSFVLDYHFEEVRSMAV